jgi:hypothetical protein
MTSRTRILIAATALVAAPLHGQSRADVIQACAEARKKETLEADAEKRKKQADAKTKRTIGHRNCGTDRDCNNQVTRTYQDEIREIANAFDLAITEIRKREIDCQTTGGTGTAGRDPGNLNHRGMMELSAELNTIRSNPLQNLLGAADRLFKGLLDWGVETLNFLAQPRGGFGEFGEPVKQIVDYLVNHKPNSFEQQYEKVGKAVEDFRRDPAYTLGKNAPNLVPLPAARAAEQATGVANAGRRLVQLNAEAKGFTPLANQITRAAANPARRPPLVEPPPLAGPDRGPVIPPSGSPYRGPPPEFGNTPMQPRSGIPPTCFENQCWQNARAVDRYWRDGVWHEPPKRGYPLAEELHDLPAPGAVILQDLRQAHGGRGALDPLHGSLGKQAHAHGIPVRSSRTQIEDVMRQKGPGAQGYVFVRWEETVGNEIARGAHVLNVRTLENDVVQFFDRATQHITGLAGAVEPALWRNAKDVFFFLTKDGR